MRALDQQLADGADGWQPMLARWSSARKSREEHRQAASAGPLGQHAAWHGLAAERQCAQHRLSRRIRHVGGCAPTGTHGEPPLISVKSILMSNMYVANCSTRAPAPIVAGGQAITNEHGQRAHSAGPGTDVYRESQR